MTTPETLPADWAAVCPVCDEPTTIISWNRDPIEVPPADHGLGYRVYQAGPTVDAIFADTHEIHGTEGLAWWKGYQATQPQLRQLRRQMQAVRELHTGDVTCDACGYQTPCPTIRALGGEA